MGLDMYLKASRYISGFEHRPEAERALYTKIVEMMGLETKDLTGCPSGTITLCIGYWRKANAIHSWFVNEVQGGEDECKPHEVSRSQLEQLKTICQQILQLREDPEAAMELLPPRAGFFFGPTDDVQWYFQGIAETIAIIDRCLKMHEDWDFIYQSSW
jgi:hypothetical protein